MVPAQSYLPRMHIEVDQRVPVEKLREIYLLLKSVCMCDVEQNGSPWSLYAYSFSDVAEATLTQLSFISRISIET